MPLRGKSPEVVEDNKRLKLLMYGEAGVGKTYTAAGFPNAYLIDTEKGAENKQYCELLKKNNSCIYQTTDMSDILSEVRTLLTEKHEYKTLIIDSISIPYNILIDEEYDRLVKSGGGNKNFFGAERKDANRFIKRLMTLIFKIDMNVIITAHAKAEYVGTDKIGNTFDCYIKSDHAFDLVIELQKNASKRLAFVKKTRIQQFKAYETFEFSYEKIIEKYNKDNMEKDSVPVILASKEQIIKLYDLLELLNLKETGIYNILRREKFENIEEVSYKSMKLYIDSLTLKIEKSTNTGEK